ncbi:MAG: undecaprenyl/decaprenyl-phosphate alpha-N-acetylglucosaminyl 1-phosphate transferase [Deltaproteobacteria bacterium]|nr:undecaprenyl/decaprenyl-phosphate alpha-N-acetylglucosaminyl 1-phosphate transferase [Deltaproteobacteria bacterium]
MLTYVVAFGLAFAIATALTPVVRNLALRYGLVDARSSRKVHEKPIPRLGGLAIVIGFYAPLVGLAIYHNSISQLLYADRLRVAGFFAGGIFIAALGLYDDLKGANARQKFAAQFIVAAVMYALGFHVDAIANPFGSPLQFGVLGFPITLVWIVGVINALNLIDGLDGLASGVAFFAVATNFLVAFVRGDILMSLLMVALAGAILGFLLFNFNPASIFMGDTGSMFLGFILATSSIVTSQKGATAVAMLVPILALGLPIMDTLLAMLRRFITGRPMFSADKEHIHHKLMALGYTHRRAVLGMYVICVFFTLASLGIMFANAPQAALILAVVGAVVFVLMRRLGYLDLQRVAEVGVTRRKNLAVRSAINSISEQLRNAANAEAIWASVQAIGEPLAVTMLELKLLTPGSESKGFTLSRSPLSPRAIEAVVPVEADGVSHGELRACWTDGRNEIGRDDELALELLADHIRQAAKRIETEREGKPLRLVVR